MHERDVVEHVGDRGVVLALEPFVELEQRPVHRHPQVPLLRVVALIEQRVSKTHLGPARLLVARPEVRLEPVDAGPRARLGDGVLPLERGDTLLDAARWILTQSKAT